MHSGSCFYIACYEVRHGLASSADSWAAEAGKVSTLCCSCQSWYFDIPVSQLVAEAWHEMRIAVA